MSLDSDNQARQQRILALLGLTIAAAAHESHRPRMQRRVHVVQGQHWQHHVLAPACSRARQAAQPGTGKAQEQHAADLLQVAAHVEDLLLQGCSACCRVPPEGCLLDACLPTGAMVFSTLAVCGGAAVCMGSARG